MLKLSRILAFSLLFFASTVQAEDKSTIVPLNLSFVGPVSFNQAFDEVRYNILCVGLLHCGAPTLKGISASLVSNTTQKDMNGLQATIFSNLALGTGRGVQASLVSNVAWNNFYGLQYSPINTIHGQDSIAVQAGLVNVIDREEVKEGAEEQPGDSFNLQLGFINYSDNPNTATLGFINLVKGGRFALQLSKGVFGHNRFAVITGGRYFYTILGFDSRAVNSGRRQYGSTSLDQLGFGVSLPLHDKIHGRLDWSDYSPSGYTQDYGTLVSATIEYQVHPMFYLHAGAERFRFRYSSWDSRISEVRTRFDFTAGTSINLTGYWN